MLILGPPRSGKGRHLVIPMLRAAPGPVVTTSTRPDNIAATLAARQARGPVTIFDPQHLAPHLTNHRQRPTATDARRSGGDGGNRNAQDRRRERWGAVVAGARLRRPADRDDPRPRARRRQRRPDREPQLLAGPDRDRAARVPARRRPRPPHRGRPVPVVARPGRRRPRRPHPAHPAPTPRPGGPTRSTPSSPATPAPATTPGPASAPPSPRSPTHAPSPPSPQPSDGDELDPDEFLDRNGTIYLLGTATGAGATANLVAALIEDLVHTARRRAAHSPGTRLDPPLALILDEAANYTLPSLPSLISEGGGTGITTIAVLQSLAQARARWGEHDGTAIYDAASSKIILGGSTNARDLHDLAQLIGERDEHTHTTSLRRHRPPRHLHLDPPRPHRRPSRAAGVAVRDRAAAAPRDAANPDHLERSRP